MEKIQKIVMFLSVIIVAAACSTDELPTSDSGSIISGGTGGASTTTGGLAQFTVSIDKTTAEPSSSASAYYPDDEDDPSSMTFTTEIAIDMSNPVAVSSNGVEVTVSGNHVTANHGTATGVCYVLSGTTANGSFSVLGDKKYGLRLNSVDITNPDSAAINLLSKKRAYITLNGSSKVADGTASLSDHKGAFYGKGKLVFGGSGAIEIYGNYNNGLHSADYIVFNSGCNIYVNSTANHGIKTNDGVIINGGILNVEVSAAAAKGINSESDIIVNGGRTTVVTTGSGAWDSTEAETKSCAGVKTDSTFTINGGELWLRSSGSGGKGIKADVDANFNGGSVFVVTEGGLYYNNGSRENTNYTGNTDNISSSYYSSPKGIKATGNVNISGGSVWVRTSGRNGEGIESKNLLSISGGETAVYAYDDAINSKSHLTVSGGYVYAQGRNNDGIDSNGNMYVKGGTVYAVASGQPEVALDANTEGGYKLYLTGGTVIAVGGIESGSSLSQACYQASSWNTDTWYSLTGADSAIAFKTPSGGGNGIVVSTASTPSLTSGVSVTGGTAYFGELLNVGGAASGGSSVSLSSYSGGRSMGNTPGMRPGGW